LRAGVAGHRPPVSDRQPIGVRIWRQVRLPLLARLRSRYRYHHGNAWLAIHVGTIVDHGISQVLLICAAMYMLLLGLRLVTTLFNVMCLFRNTSWRRVLALFWTSLTLALLFSNLFAGSVRWTSRKRGSQQGCCAM
jgi:hypothetical protein